MVENELGRARTDIVEELREGEGGSQGILVKPYSVLLIQKDMLLEHVLSLGILEIASGKDETQLIDESRILVEYIFQRNAFSQILPKLSVVLTLS